MNFGLKCMGECGDVHRNTWDDILDKTNCKDQSIWKCIGKVIKEM